MDARATSPDEPLGTENEAQWERLRSQLDLADGFWLGFVFSPSPRSVIVLRERVERLLRAQTKALLMMRPATPEELRGVLKRLVEEEAPARAGCVWVEAVRSDPVGAKERPWIEAWDELFLRMNVRRDVLRKRLLGGLVLAGPPEIKARVREAAPDLWSVRSLVIDMGAVRSAGETERPATLPLEISVGPALDPEFALEEAARRGAAGSGGRALKRTAETSRARALMQATEGLLIAGRSREAREAALEAWALLRGSFEEAAALASLAMAEAADADPAAAADHIERAIAMREEADREGAPIPWYLLAGKLSFERSDLATAKAILADATGFARGRALPRNPEGLHDLASVLCQRGAVRREAGDLDGAVEALEESLTLYRRMSGLEPGAPEGLLNVAVASRRLGNLRRLSGNLVAATTALEESLTLLRRLRELRGETRGVLRELASTLDGVGRARRESGDLEAATAAFEEVLALSRRLCEMSGDAPEHLKDLSIVLVNLGGVRYASGNLSTATDAFEESLTLCCRLRERDGDTPGALRDTLSTLLYLGMVRRDDGAIDTAVSLHEEATALARKLTALPEARRHLLVIASASRSPYVRLLSPAGQPATRPPPGPPRKKPPPSPRPRDFLALLEERGICPSGGAADGSDADSCP